MDLSKNGTVASELLELHSAESASFYAKEIIPNHNKPVPRLQIALLVVGTRGDVQPFLAVAKRLQACLQTLHELVHFSVRSFCQCSMIVDGHSFSY